MNFAPLLEKAQDLIKQSTDLLNASNNLKEAVSAVQEQAAVAAMTQQGVSPFIFGLTVFILAVFVGYYVVWRVTPALHSPLMAVTNAISSVIIVGALLASGLSALGFAKILGFLAVILASVNIFGGFIVTQRMLHMFMKKK
ncbi:MAG: NAD(P) transhydrogenase subunit alpha [Candidatus Paracaedimonas acanthamoebae]|uniref:proton-translocating NAD(P)(+) transhydrogenase n=1 Tax=Candidatus Paracaedimonas acanthamoebae TaxID=244581 RepID=A0A8J7TVC4_9PROT|nr:NAD(P) transhydrogenase subunit alpha [Candidatus Paracaedimonas acanthamoebae]